MHPEVPKEGATVEEALADPHFQRRGLFERKLGADGHEIPALPVHVADDFRAEAGLAGYPSLAYVAAGTSA